MAPGHRRRRASLGGPERRRRRTREPAGAGLRSRRIHGHLPVVRTATTCPPRAPSRSSATFRSSAPPQRSGRSGRPVERNLSVGAGRPRRICRRAGTPRVAACSCCSSPGRSHPAARSGRRHRPQRDCQPRRAARDPRSGRPRRHDVPPDRADPVERHLQVAAHPPHGGGRSRRPGSGAPAGTAIGGAYRRSLRGPGERHIRSSEPPHRARRRRPADQAPRPGRPHRHNVPFDHADPVERHVLVAAGGFSWSAGPTWFNGTGPYGHRSADHAAAQVSGARSGGRNRRTVPADDAAPVERHVPAVRTAAPCPGSGRPGRAPPSGRRAPTARWRSIAHTRFSRTGRYRLRRSVSAEHAEPGARQVPAVDTATACPPITPISSGDTGRRPTTRPTTRPSSRRRSRRARP